MWNLIWAGRWGLAQWFFLGELLLCVATFSHLTTLLSFLFCWEKLSGFYTTTFHHQHFSLEYFSFFLRRSSDVLHSDINQRYASISRTWSLTLQELQLSFLFFSPSSYFCVIEDHHMFTFEDPVFDFFFFGKKQQIVFLNIIVSASFEGTPLYDVLVISCSCFFKKRRTLPLCASSWPWMFEVKWHVWFCCPSSPWGPTQFRKHTCYHLWYIPWCFVALLLFKKKKKNVTASAGFEERIEKANHSRLRVMRPLCVAPADRRSREL